MKPLTLSQLQTDWVKAMLYRYLWHGVGALSALATEIKSIVENSQYQFPKNEKWKIPLLNVFLIEGKSVEAVVGLLATMECVNVDFKCLWTLIETKVRKDFEMAHECPLHGMLNVVFGKNYWTPANEDHTKFDFKNLAITFKQVWKVTFHASFHLNVE